MNKQSRIFSILFPDDKIPADLVRANKLPEIEKTIDKLVTMAEPAKTKKQRDQEENDRINAIVLKLGDEGIRWKAITNALKEQGYDGITPDGVKSRYNTAKKNEARRTPATSPEGRAWILEAAPKEPPVEEHVEVCKPEGISQNPEPIEQKAEAALQAPEPAVQTAEPVEQIAEDPMRNICFDLSAKPHDYGRLDLVISASGEISNDGEVQATISRVAERRAEATEQTAESTVQTPESSEQKPKQIDDEELKGRVYALADRGMAVKDISKALWADEWIECPWTKVRSILARRPHAKEEAPAPDIPAPKARPQPAAPSKPLPEGKESWPPSVSMSRGAPDGCSRAAVDGKIWDLHLVEFTPEEIAVELKRSMGLEYTGFDIERRLAKIKQELGVKDEEEAV